MALVLQTFKMSLSSKIQKVLTDRNSKTDEGESPEKAIKDVADALADAISSAVDDYIKTADVIVGPAHIQVTSTAPGTPATVATLTPAKIK